MATPSSPENDITVELIERALAGDTAAQSELYPKLTRLIDATVAHVCGSARRQEVMDVVQEVLIHLSVKDGGKRLRQWDPRRGAAFLKTITRNEAIAVLRVEGKYPSRHVGLPQEDFEKLAGHGDDQEKQLADLRLRGDVLADLKAELSARDAQVLELLLDGHPTASICEKTGMETDNAVYLVREDLKKARLIVELREAPGR